MFNSWHLEDIIHYAPLLATGLGYTLLLSLATMATSLMVAMGVTLLRVFRVPVLSQLMSAYVYLVRSIPVIMLIGLIHFGILPLLGFENSYFFSAYVALTLSTTAYVSEVYRGGFRALRSEEIEGARSLGLSFWQRWGLVLLPLVVMRMMPSLVNQFVTVIKDTSLASIVGVIELTRAAEIIYERTFHDATLLAFIALVYFILCYALSCLARNLESSAPATMA